MTPWRLFIHCCLSSLSVLLCSVKDKFNIRNLGDLNLMKLEFILVCHYLSDLIRWIKQISHCLDVNFKATHHQFNISPILLLVFLESFKNHINRPWNEAHCLWSKAAFHSKSFSSICLSIGKNAYSKSIPSTSHNISNFIEHIFLRWAVTKDFIKFELMTINLLRLGWLSSLEQRLLVGIKSELILLSKKFWVDRESQRVLILNLKGVLYLW